MNLLADLNPDQQRAVTHQGSPLLILAGAGSGKTRALTYRAAYLLDHEHISPEQILLTTFTNKAAGEMQERLQNLAGQRLPFAGTFHSLCARFLRQHGLAVGIAPDFVIYDTDDQLDVIKSIMVEIDVDPQFVKPRSVIAAIDGSKNELITPSAYSQFARGPFQRTVAEIYPRYQTRLRDYHALDFTDLLSETVKLFTTSEKVRNHYQQQFQHVLIDEYQDTNKAQYSLTKLWLGPHQNLCVVGDASQAIYSWRGADYHNLLALKTDFPNLTTIKLEQNYRSTQNILDAAFGVIKQNELHPILDLWTESQSGEAVYIFEGQDEYDEARYAARAITDYQKEGHNLRDTAILFRTNAQSRVFEEILLEKGIPYILVGGMKFYERKEIKDVIAYLRITYNPQDKVSLTRVEKLGKRRLAIFQQWRETADITQPPIVLLEAVMSASSYLSRFDSHDPEDQARLENVAELKSVAQNFHSLAEFLENISLVEQDTRRVTDADAAVLMTLHASKGLEFDQVIIAGMEEGIFPHSRSLDSKDDLEEERRLCYVGMTRARKKLHLTYTQSRMYFGMRSQNMTSRFVEELPDHVTELQTSKRSASTKPNRPTVITETDNQLLDDFLAGKIDIEDFLKN
jgi:DNA helicase-2/ATP-dependent DNA helicase PcrA